MSDVLYLSSEEVAELASYSEYVDAIRDGYRQRGNGGSASAPTTISTKGSGESFNSYINSYMAELPSANIGGTYQFSVDEQDRWYLATLYDTTDGEPIALIDGGSWMSTKTGGIAAVGADALSRPDSSTVGIIGSGRVARESLRSICTIRAIESVDVYSPTEANRESFAVEMAAELDAEISPVTSDTAAVRDADIVLTATTAPEPVFDGSALESGTHVCAMGQSGAHREIDDTTVARSKYVPDIYPRTSPSSHQDRLKAAGAFVSAYTSGAVSDNHVYAELGDVVVGRVPGRDSASEITVFDSTGTGIETIAAGYMLYKKAQKKELGTNIQISSLIETQRL